MCPEKNLTKVNKKTIQITPLNSTNTNSTRFGKVYIYHYNNESKQHSLYSQYICIKKNNRIEFPTASPQFQL